MKKWNTPEVTELNINETANGWHNWWDEGTTEPLTGWETITGSIPNPEEGKEGTEFAS